MAAAPPATGPPAPVASLSFLHKDAGPPEERGCFVVGPPDHGLLGGFANVSVAPAGSVALHVPLYFVEAALLSVVGTTGGPEAQGLGAKRLTIDKIIDMCDFLLDLGFHYSGTAEDTLHRLNMKTFTPDLLSDPRLALPPEACLATRRVARDGGLLGENCEFPLP